MTIMNMSIESRPSTPSTAAASKCFFSICMWSRFILSSILKVKVKPKEKAFFAMSDLSELFVAFFHEIVHQSWCNPTTFSDQAHPSMLEIKLIMGFIMYQIMGKNLYRFNHLP